MMATVTQETLVELSGRESLTLGRLRGQVVECRSGEVWLTVDGEAGDVILGPNGKHAVVSNGPVVVSAFKPSVLSLRGCRPLAVGVGGALAAFLHLPQLHLLPSTH